MSAHDQARLFDELSAEGALYVYAAQDLQRLRERIHVQAPALDIGCGDGAIAEALAEGFIAFDISPKCARLASKRGVRSIVADATGTIPYADASFATVTTIDVLHHMHGAWEGIAAECYRVLQDGGRWIVVEPDACNAFVRLTQDPASFMRVAPFDDEPAIYPNDLVPLIEAAGFECSVEPFHLDGDQVVRSVFPMWQRIAKAPFVLAMAWWRRHQPNKFLIEARKRPA